MSDGLFPALEAAASDRLAISFPDRSLSYAALRDASARVASSLAGVSRVAVLAESRLETCVAVIGALQAGVPVIPINPRSGAS
jgi:malonyl-CoA/methylmalonyl-CoA synthetase